MSEFLAGRGWREEHRPMYETPEGEVPEGWVFLRNEFNDRGFFALYADSKEYRPDRQTKWVTLIPYEERRLVTDWERVE